MQWHVFMHPTSSTKFVSVSYYYNESAEETIPELRGLHKIVIYSQRYEVDDLGWAWWDGFCVKLQVQLNLVYHSGLLHMWSFQGFGWRDNSYPRKIFLWWWPREWKHLGPLQPRLGTGTLTLLPPHAIDQASPIAKAKIQYQRSIYYLMRPWQNIYARKNYSQ